MKEEIILSLDSGWTLDTVTTMLISAKRAHLCVGVHNIWILSAWLRGPPFPPCPSHPHSPVACCLGMHFSLVEIAGAKVWVWPACLCGTLAPCSSQKTVPFPFPAITSWSHCSRCLTFALSIAPSESLLVNFSEGWRGQEERQQNLGDPT